MADKYSRIAAGVKPYVVSWMRDILAHVPATGGGAGGGGVVVSGAPSPHALSGTHHSGVLLDSQAPQFLLVDGSRSLTGDWSVDPGITIDGVDLSAHAANADAHHATNHVLATNSALGPTHTISGATAGHVLRASGASAANFQQLAHGDLGSVTANQHHNQQHGIVSSDHTGTGNTLDVVGFSGTNTLGVLTPSSDVGTTPMARILASTAGGGLTLASLNVMGEATVDESLYAANNTLRALYHTHDGTDHVHLIINPTGAWSLDEQFGVDIDDNLLVRGYIVGNLTIQIRDMAPVMTFDGPFPYFNNYKGSAIGSNGQNMVIPSGNKAPIFVEGKFGKAIQIARSATNLCTNPSAETATTGYTGNGTATVTRDTLYSVYGSYSIKTVTGGSAFDGVTWGTFSTTTGQPYAAGVWVKRTETGAVLRLSLRESTGAQIGAVPIPQQLGWQFVSCSGTATITAATGRIYVQQTSSGAVTFYIDGLMIENRAYCTPPAIGDMTTGEGDDAHAWSGTAHASTSTRTNTTGYYPTTSPVNPKGGRGSAGIWFRAPWGTDAPTGVAHALFNGGSSNLYARVDTSGDFQVRVGSGTDISYTDFAWDTEWHLFFVTWDTDTEAKMYLDGVEVASSSSFGEVSQSNSFYVGSFDNTSLWFDGWLDHMMFASRALDPEEILAIYEAEGPAFAYHASYHLRAGRNRIWFDDEGGWGVTAGGRKLFAMYAGVDDNPSATKSWGGLSLSEGDILFGQRGLSNGGWMYFDQDFESSLPGWVWGYADTEVLELSASGADLTGTLAVTGEINIASGALIIDPDGVTMQSGTGDINRLDWIAPSDAGHMASIRAEGNTLGGPSDLYIIAGGVGPAQQGVGQGRQGTILLGAYSDANTDDGPEIEIGYGGSIVLRSDNSGSPPTLTIAQAGFTFANGTFLADLVMAAGEYLHTDRVRALSASGLRLEDDGGNVGLFVEDATGHVGVRQTSPSYALHIGGSLEDGSLAIESTAGRKFIARADDTGLFTHLGTESNHQFRIVTNNTEAILIDTSQRVGINATPSEAQLEVISDDNARYAAIFNSASSPTEDILKVQRNSVEQVVVTADGDLKLVDSDTTTGPQLILQTTGAHADNNMAGTIRAYALTSSADEIIVDLYFQMLESTSANLRSAFFVVTQHGAGAGGVDKVPFAAMGASVGLVGASLETYLGGGKGVVALGNAETVPSSDPTAGGILYVEGGALKYRSQGGKTTTLATNT